MRDIFMTHERAGEGIAYVSKSHAHHQSVFRPLNVVTLGSFDVHVYVLTTITVFPSFCSKLINMFNMYIFPLFLSLGYKHQFTRSFISRQIQNACFYRRMAGADRKIHT